MAMRRSCETVDETSTTGRQATTPRNQNMADSREKLDGNAARVGLLNYMQSALVILCFTTAAIW